MAGTTKANNGVIALYAGKRSVRRKLLLAGVMALTPAAAGMAWATDSMPAGCVVSDAGAKTTCSGDQSGGLQVYSGDALIVTSLTTSIGSSADPLTSDGAGVGFYHKGGKLDVSALTLDVDTTGTSGIWVANGNGVEVDNYGAGTTTVTSKGDISVVSTDEYTASGIAVYAGTGKVDLTSASNITLTTDGGEDPSGGILVANHGDISITNTGIIIATKTGDYGDVAGIDAVTYGAWGGYGNSGLAGGEAGQPGTDGSVGPAGELGGKIDIHSAGDIQFSGVNVAGIAAESYGGRGGYGGDGGAGAAGQDNPGNTGGTGGNGGSGGAGGQGGAGGDITVDASGAITGEGSGATGISARSGGGGGGIGATRGRAGAGGGGETAGAPGADGVNGAGGDGGDGGKVTITSSADIAISGDGATGLRVESIGGKAQQGGYEGNGGDVHVTNSGDIAVDGGGVSGISVASLGGEMGNLTVDNSGTVTATNSGNAYRDTTSRNSITVSSAVAFTGGAGNTLNNSGTIDGAGFIDYSGPRFAVTAQGYTAINNSGVINGSVDLIGLAPAVINLFTNGSSSYDTFQDFLDQLHMYGNSVNNMDGGTFNAGFLVALGAGNTLTNSGDFTAGGDPLRFEDYSGAGTVLIGDLDQTSTGRLNVNLDVANNSANQLYVLGNVNLGGTIVVTPRDLSGDSFNTPIVATFGLFESSPSPIQIANGITDNGVSLLASPALHANLEWHDHSDDKLALADTSLTAPASYDGVSIASDGIDYRVEGLTAAEQQVADHLQEQFLKEHPQYDAAVSAKSDAANNDKLFLALLTPMELAQYKAALDQLTPSSGASSGSASSNTSSQFTNAMLSCRQASGAYAYIREGQCSWAQLKQRVTERSWTLDAPGSRAYVTSLAAGVQKSIGKGWFAGFGLGFAHDDISNTDKASSSGNEAMAGVVVKYAPGPVSLALALDAGMGWNDNKRSITLLNETATASNTQNHLGAQLRAAYLLDHGLWYAKPMLDLNATLLNIGGYTETGSSSNLTVMASKTTILSMSPAIEIGGQFKLANGALVRPYAKAGLTVFGTSSIDTTAHLVGTTGDFTVSSTGDRTLVDLTGGLDILATDGITLRLNAESHFGATTKDIAASAKVGWSF